MTFFFLCRIILFYAGFSTKICVNEHERRLAENYFLELTPHCEHFSN